MAHTPRHPKQAALHRSGPSAPLRWLLQGGYFPGPAAHLPDGFRVLDYGCGHGADVRHLRGLGYTAAGWDPYHPGVATEGMSSWYPLDGRWDVVLCTYVLNVSRDMADRNHALATIRTVLTPNGVAFVTVRRDLDGDTETQRLIPLDFPCIHDGTDFATYRVTAAY